jgi:hypothetical protein
LQNSTSLCKWAKRAWVAASLLAKTVGGAVGEFALQGGGVGGGKSWFEGGEGAHDDAVGAAVGDVAIGNEEHEE